TFIVKASRTMSATTWSATVSLLALRDAGESRRRSVRSVLVSSSSTPARLNVSVPLNRDGGRPESYRRTVNLMIAMLGQRSLSLFPGCVDQAFDAADADAVGRCEFLLRGAVVEGRSDLPALVGGQPAVQCMGLRQGQVVRD